MKKRNYLIISILIIFVIILIIFVGDKSIDVTSTQINDLYKLLGDINLVQCGSLNSYNEKETKAEDIPLENRLCLAYNYTAQDNLEVVKAKSDSLSSNKVQLCKVKDDITFTGENNECNYVIISQDNINETYQKLYGKDIPEYLNFSPTTEITCYIDNNEYYCGSTETYNLTLYPNTNILRLKNKALKNYSGEIIIEDYYLRIADNKCYKTNGQGEEDTSCTEQLAKYKDFNKESNEEKTKFIKKYGQKYRHVFKLNKTTNEYYWYKSYQK